MPVKRMSAFVAMILVFLYVGPVVLKLRDPALAVVVLVGIALIVVDLWQSLQSRDD